MHVLSILDVIAIIAIFEFCNFTNFSLFTYFCFDYKLKESPDKKIDIHFLVVQMYHIHYTKYYTWVEDPWIYKALDEKFEEL